MAIDDEESSFTLLPPFDPSTARRPDSFKAAPEPEPVAETSAKLINGARRICGRQLSCAVDIIITFSTATPPRVVQGRVPMQCTYRDGEREWVAVEVADLLRIHQPPSFWGASELTLMR